jgi:hypothetical protein
MTLLEMIDFFEINEVTPNERLGETITSLKGVIKKRFNAIIAIIRDIEKHQTKPTATMLQSLFEETIDIEKEEEENYDFESPKLITENEELEYYRKQYFSMKTENQNLKNDMTGIMENLKYVKNNFGTDYYKLDFSKEDVETLKQKLD